MGRASALALTILTLIGAGPGVAQQSLNPVQGGLELGVVISPVLTIDRERVFRDSAFGRRVATENQGRRENLAAENRQIESELAAEEQDLTQRRSTLPAEDFRILADAFDQKVQETEKTQLGKERVFAETRDREWDSFWTTAVPVLEGLMLESGAFVILDRRSVFISVSVVDVTEKTIALIDETIGAGPAPE